MSLVAAYGNSDSDTENSSHSNDANDNTKYEIIGTMGNLPSPENSSGEEDITSLTTQETKIMPIMDKLPIPGFLANNNRSQTNNGLTNLPTTSVFSNPYVEAEKAKKLALEKHVKMVDGGAAITINGKKVCWSYRKGRCRFGHNCKYAHDSDIQKSTAQLAAENQIQETVVCQSDNAGPPLGNIKTNDNISDEESNNGNNFNKRKRPGLSQGLKPGKKVLKQYQKLKNHH